MTTYLRSVGVIGCSVGGRRRPRKRYGMRGAVRIAAIGDGGRGNDVVFIIVVVSGVVNVESNLVQVLFEVGDCAPHG